MRCLAIATVLMLSAGCEPTCKATCKKLISCDEVETARVSLDECTTSCEIRQELYQEWTDTELQEDFSDLKQCIQDSDCADIADAVCYDETLYIW